jgi:hypothetical protein
MLLKVKDEIIFRITEISERKRDRYSNLKVSELLILQYIIKALNNYTRV